MYANKLAALHLLQLLGAGLPANVTTISSNSINISQNASQTTPKSTMITSAVALTITVTAEPLPKPSMEIVKPHSTSTCHTNPFTCTTVSSATVSTGTMSSSSLATPTHFSSSSATTVSLLV
uniref:Uncharacterized protein n=1 Tax=Amphimedon queenslandica TaxID=400682 RepID=A0A1X7V966_AMPQE